MTDRRLEAMVDEAVALDRDISQKTEQLKALKAELIAEANHRDGDWEDAGAGKRWTAAGSDGSIARVNFPGPSIGKFERGSPVEASVLSLLGEHVRKLLESKVTYHPVKSFRELLPALAGKATANKVLKLLETPNAPRVSFETKEAA